MRKNIIKILLTASLATALFMTGCTNDEPASEVTTPEETAHVTEDEVTEENAEDTTEEATPEDGTESADDNAVYDPDKESVIYENYKVSLFDGFSTVKAQDYLKENIKFLTVEKADQAILDLRKTFTRKSKLLYQSDDGRRYSRCNITCL